MTTTPPFILLHDSDNVFVCRRTILRGDLVTIDDDVIEAEDVIEVGHKIARRSLVVGERVLKYGAPIGSVTHDIEKGAHVHTHNMQSDLIASHTWTDS